MGIFMELFQNTLLFIFILCIGASAICMAIGGLLYAIAHGNSQKQMVANGCIIGSVACLLFGGAAFFVPGAIYDMILKPLGVVPQVEFTGRNCDDTLRYQLVQNPQASSAERVSAVVHAIQARYPECVNSSWSPEVTASSNCSGTVAGTEIPTGLRGGGTRDQSNNIMVNFDDPPGDGAECWLYESRLGLWLSE